MRRWPWPGIPKRQVDGLRVTDAPTLDVVVAVLPARSTRASSRRSGAPAPRPVGLTGADATVATVKRAAPITTVAGERVDLGLVGAPVANGRPQLLADLMGAGMCRSSPASARRDGRLMNVNADTLASHLARRSARGGWSLPAARPACSTSTGRRSAA